MAQLDVSNPNNPKFSYLHNGDVVEGGVHCNCGTDTTCQQRCKNQAQALLDAALSVLSED